MVALPLFLAAASFPDLAALQEGIAKCERKAVTRAFAEEADRRTAALIDGFAEQQAIAAARRALAERRIAMASLPPGPATLIEQQAITTASEQLDDRQRVLNDVRAADALYRQAMDDLRQRYLQSCTDWNRNGAR